MFELSNELALSFEKIGLYFLFLSSLFKHYLSFGVL